MHLLLFLWFYWQAKNNKFTNRTALEAYQQKQLQRFQAKTLSKSPYFQQFAHLKITDYPLMNKKIMMDHFDEMNTEGLKLQEILNLSLASEKSRDFSPMINNISVGLSSGTSSLRGVFAASPKERAKWAAILLSKLLDHGLFHGERVALFLRADNQLYKAVNNRWISFQFFDLFKPFAEELVKLQAFSPSIIVAPAQVLKALTQAYLDQEIHIQPKMLIAVAEVLDDQDKDYIKQLCPDIREIYQATEGFLGASCAQGNLHLNEENIYFEKEWLDEQRFLPIVTDFTRSTQPIVRYRLDDVLVIKKGTCSCGNPALMLEKIEGRYSDVFLLPAIHNNKEITVFSDMCSRVFAQTLPLEMDYQLTLYPDYQLELIIEDESYAQQCQTALSSAFKQLGVDIQQLHWTLLTAFPEGQMHQKRRKIKCVHSETDG